MKHLIRTFALFALAALTACGGSDATGPAPSVAGIYTLASVNGSPLPFTYFENTAGRVQYASATMNLRADSSFVEHVNRAAIFFSRPDLNDARTIVEHGTYSLTGASLVLTYTAADRLTSYQGTLENGVLRFVHNQRAYEYRR